ncbi:MAG: hypothetical protein R2707_06660 [Acidimicrobiales bacterium]
MRKLVKAALAALLLAAPLAVASPAGASSNARVTNGNASGPGSFAQAVEDANHDASIRRIVFDRGLTVEVDGSVVFDGGQRLTVDGNGSTVTGAGLHPAATWDGGLFVSAGDSRSLTVTDLTFEDSPNNGMAVFVPEDQTGTLNVTLRKVAVDGAQFHGILVDAQNFAGFNTDDVPHPNCVDPHPFDSAASVRVSLTDVDVTGAGSLAPYYDVSIETGCPQDFDGVRVDEGGTGSLSAFVIGGSFDGNLADGMELDETGDGTVAAWVFGASFSGNGETVPVPFDGGFAEDLDDGFDIDETGAGDLLALVVNATVDGNFDEGLDFDEAGPGNVVATVVATRADGNEDEGMKADEEGPGDLRFDLVYSASTDSASQDGVQVEEVDDGNVVVNVVKSTITGNDSDGVKADESGNGDLRVDVVSSDLSNNGSNATDIEEADAGVGRVSVERSKALGYAGDEWNNDVDTEVLVANTVD